MSVTLSKALASEWFRFRKRRFTWIALAATTAAGFLGAVAPRVTEEASRLSARVGGGGGSHDTLNAFYYLSTGSKGVALLTALFLALAAAPAIAGEMAQGTLRLALARPVARGRLFAAKALVLCGFAQALLVFGCVAALAGASIVSDFGPVTNANVVKVTESAMVSHTMFAMLVCEFAILGTLALSLLASTVTDSAVSATSATLGILVFVAFAAFWFDAAKPFLFATYTTSPFDTLNGFAQGIDAPWPTWFGISKLQDWADVTFALALPGVTAACLFSVAGGIFVRRDWLA